MKKIMLKALIAILITSGSSYAQSQQVSDEQIEQIIERIEETKARLNLSDEQAEEVRPIFEENVQSSLEILKSYGFERGQKPKLNFRKKLALRRDMNEVRDNTDNKLKTILTDAQMQEYAIIRDERRKELRNRLGL